MVRQHSAPHNPDTTSKMLSDVGAEVLDHMQNNASTSKPAIELSASDAAFVRQLCDIDPDLLRHPEFTKAMILKVDEICRDDAEAVQGVLALASGVKYILDEKNLQHVVSVPRAQWRKARSDKIVQMERNVAHSTGQSTIASNGAIFEEPYLPSNDKDVNRRICTTMTRLQLHLQASLRLAGLQHRMLQSCSTHQTRKDSQSRSAQNTNTRRDGTPEDECTGVVIARTDGRHRADLMASEHCGEFTTMTRLNLTPVENGREILSKTVNERRVVGCFHSTR